MSRYVVGLLALPLAWFGVFAAGGWLEPDGSGSDLFALECGRRLAAEPLEGMAVVASARVALAWDEEWWDRQPESAEADARRLLLEASSMFRGIGIHLLAVRASDWESPDEAGSVRELLSAAEAAIPTGDADIVVVFSGQRPATSEDGFAEVGGTHVMVTHHPDRPENDAHVLAHEISHLFGAHHGCDAPGFEGLMAESGFEDADFICPCTRRVLELNSRRFHEEAA